MKFAVILFTLLATPLLADDADDSPYELFDEWYTYLKAANKKLIVLKYQNEDCFEFIMKKNNSKCNIKTLFQPVDTPACQDIRNSTSKPSFSVVVPIIVLNSVYDKTNPVDGVDPNTINTALKEFNQIPESERTDEQYAAIYNSSTKYIAEGYASLMIVHSKTLRQCVLDVIASPYGFFGNAHAPQSNKSHNVRVIV